MNQANSLVTTGHDVEIASVLRHCDEPRFPLDPRVRITALIYRRPDDGRTDPATAAGGPKATRSTRRYAALARARPELVPADCPTGPADVLTDGREGLLVPAEDTEALAGALSRLMGDRALREKLGSAAAQTARGYAPGVVHPQWESLFSELLTRRSGGSDRGRR